MFDIGNYSVEPLKTVRKKRESPGSHAKAVGTHMVCIPTLEHGNEKCHPPAPLSFRPLQPDYVSSSYNKTKNTGDDPRRSVAE